MPEELPKPVTPEAAPTPVSASPVVPVLQPITPPAPPTPVIPSVQPISVVPPTPTAVLVATPAATTHKSRRTRIMIEVGSLVVLLLIAGSTFAYIKGIGPFSKAVYTESNLLSGVLMKSSSINSLTYKATVSLAVVPREAGAIPFQVSTTTNDGSGSSYGDTSTMAELSQQAAYLPAELSASISAGASVDFQSSDWKFNADASGDFGDLTYKVNIDALKKNADYYLRINNIPSVFFLADLSSVKGQWIKLTGATSTDAEYSTLGYLSANIQKTEAGYKEERAKEEDLLKKMTQIAEEQKLVAFLTAPTKESVDGRTLYKYSLTINKAAVVPFYQELIAQAKNDPELSVESFVTDPTFLEYLQSDDFQKTFDYLNQNTFITLWVDESGYPAILDYRLRIVPPDTAVNLKDKQANLDFKLTFDDINQPVDVTAPTDAKSVDDLLNDPNSPLGAARAVGNDAKIKSYLVETRAPAAIYYNDNANSFGAGNTCTTGMFADSSSGLATYTLASNYPSGTTLVCHATKTAYAISANLGTAGQYWCVDSTGNSKAETTALKGTVCP